MPVSVADQITEPLLFNAWKLQLLLNVAPALIFYCIHHPHFIVCNGFQFILEYVLNYWLTHQMLYGRHVKHTCSLAGFRPQVSLQARSSQGHRVAPVILPCPHSSGNAAPGLAI